MLEAEQEFYEQRNAAVHRGAHTLAVDATENTHLFWASAAEALQLADAGQIAVIFPTRRNLERLAQFATFAEVKTHAENIPVRMVTPFVGERDGQKWLLIPKGQGYPVDGEALSAIERG